MNEHERSVRLAATGLSEPLTLMESTDLDEHLRDCPACRHEHASLANDHQRLRVLVAPLPVGEAIRANVLAGIGVRRPFGVVQLLLVAAILLALLAAIALGVGRQPRPRLPAGFAGAWTTTNCAHWFAGASPTFDCDRWGDGATVRLTIGPGEPASLRVSGTTRPDCTGTGTLNVDPPQVRDGTFLFFEIPGSTCPLIELGSDRASHLYLEPGDRRIWFDDDGDGWGLFWTRTE